MSGKMNPEVKPLWLEALRSGEYEQGEGLLHAGDKFCCLGILCEVAIKAGLTIEVRPEDERDDQQVVLYDGESAGLPDTVRDWSGVEDLGQLPVTISYKGEREKLSALNDVGMPFAEIADIIEREL